MESSSVRPTEAAAPEVPAVPVLSSLSGLTMLGTPEGGDVCGVDGVCL